MKYLYIVYQYVIAFPLLWVLTMLTSIITIILFPWPNSKFVNWTQKLWSRSFGWLLFLPVQVTGKENIKPGQSYIFVANHQSMLDVWIVYGWLPVVFKWLMKAELRKVPFVGSACKAAGHVFVDRSSPMAAQRSLKEVEKVLTNGVCTVIFPEGTRSLNGQVGRFKRGAFQIALELNLPIIPISLTGCFEAMNRKCKYVTRHPIHMHIGEPIMPEQFNKENPHETMDLVRDIVIRNMQVD